MNKSDLINALSEGQNISIPAAASIVNVILQTMTQSLVSGDNIEIRGFGSLTVRCYDSYIWRNPKIKEKVTVKAKKVPFFKVSKDL